MRHSERGGERLGRGGATDIALSALAPIGKVFCGYRFI